MSNDLGRKRVIGPDFDLIPLDQATESKGDTWTCALLTILIVVSVFASCYLLEASSDKPTKEARYGRSGR